MKKLLIGLVSYKDLHYLRECLPVLEELRAKLKAEVVIVDNAHDEAVREFVEQHFPKMNYWRHPEGNVGYGRSYNAVLKHFPGAEYFLVTTSDVFLDVDKVADFVKRMRQNEALALCAGKLHFWDVERHRRTRVIDTVGIVATRRHHFYEQGAGEEDKGQYDEWMTGAFGASGAAFLIRTAVIPKLHGKAWQLFDERMWMYKEDVDLNYRLRWLGEEIRVFPEVWGWHARTVANREGQGWRALLRADAGKRAYGRQHSYVNHWLLLKNNMPLRCLPRVLAYEMLKGLYMALRHPRVFLRGLGTLLFVKGRRSDRVVSSKVLLSYFE